MISLLVLALFACNGKDGDNNDDGTDDFIKGDIDDDGVIDVVGDPTETIDGDLSTGAVIDLGWADDGAVACWPGNENPNFTGKHVFFTVDKEGSGNIVVQVDPASGVDVSLYVLEFAGGVQTPPDVSSAARCEASYDQQGDSNPGKAEAVGPLIGFSDDVMLVGVAGANGESAGAFTVGIWKMDGGLE